MPSSVTFLIQKNSHSSLENTNMLDPSSDQRSVFLTRLDDDHRNKNSQFSKLDNQGEAILLDTEVDQQQTFSPKDNPSIPIVNKTSDIDLFSPDELEINPKKIQPSLASLTRTRTNINSTVSMNIQTRRPISKIPIRSNSSLQSPIRTQSKRQISSPVRNNGAFHFFTPDSRHTETLSFKDHRKRLASSDDEDIETHHLKEDDLKVKLKEEKKYRRKTGELLSKLHENYEELLEKYAQAENTIDQLRFQPKPFDENTPRSITSEHFVHHTHLSKAQLPALRSSGVYRSTAGSPFSSIRPVPSTTTTTPARKSVSPANSGTIESIVFDEATPEKFNRDLLSQTRVLADKMKSFLTLMDANQLNLMEQKQIYETIKQDYEGLIKDFDRKKLDGGLNTELSSELESMKQLLTEIVKKITQNLLGKSTIDSSSSDRQTSDNSHSSQLSVRSSLCNHNDLMDQYETLLHAANSSRKEPIRSIVDEVPANSQIHPPSTKTKQKPYVYVSGDSDDEQQENDGVTPIPYTKGVESTSFELDYIPSTSVKHHQHRVEEQQRHENHQSKRKHKEIRPRTNDYDSGIGTNNLTKLSHESKFYPNTMDESHLQSLDDEQDSISSSSSRSSGSGSASPGSPHRRFDKRGKPIDHSNSRLSNTESHITGSFDPLPPPSSSSYKKKTMLQSYHTWKPQKNSSLSHRSRLTPMHRSTSTGNPSIEDYKTRSRHSSITPHISSKIKTNRDYYHLSKPPPPLPPSSYRSSIYINQTHTNRKSPEKLRHNLYLDQQTGIVYRYDSGQISNSPKIYHESSPLTRLYECTECGAVTTYHHRHHINSSSKRIPTNTDDLGYESGYQKRSRRYRYTDDLSSSDSDSDISPTYLEMMALNQAYNRAENIRHQSRCLSRYIVRQLKFALATTH